MEYLDHLPTRFHIGTQRAGSTYLNNALKNHPEVSLSSYQEVSFYNERFERGFDWYINSFLNNNKIKIDTTPRYFLDGNLVARLISEYVGSHEPRFLLILRNPIEYVYSHFNLQLRKGSILTNYPNCNGSFLDLIDKYPCYLSRGLYYQNLSQNWLHYFNIDKFKILIFEDYIKNFDYYFREICDFFGLSYLDQSLLKIPVTAKNSNLKYSFPKKISSWLSKHKKIKRKIEFIKYNKLFDYTYEKLLIDNKSRKTELSTETRKYLRSFYQDDIKKLETLLKQNNINNNLSLTERWK